METEITRARMGETKLDSSLERDLEIKLRRQELEKGFLHLSPEIRKQIIDGFIRKEFFPSDVIFTPAKGNDPNISLNYKEILYGDDE